MNCLEIEFIETILHFAGLYSEQYTITLELEEYIFSVFIHEITTRKVIVKRITRDEIKFLNGCFAQVIIEDMRRKFEP